MEMIYAACAAWVFVYVLGMYKFKYKPLNCEKCMAGWICLILAFGRYVWYEIPFMMCVSMCLVLIINRLISK